MSKKTCCVIGQRPNEFPWSYRNTNSARHQEYLEAMACYIDRYISKHGVNHFICGGERGVDTDFAKIVIPFRHNVYYHIDLEFVLPYKGYEEDWADKDKYEHDLLLENADSVNYLFDCFTKNGEEKRYKYMIDNSDIVFAFWNKNLNDGEIFNLIEYAKSKGKILDLFILNYY